MPPRTSLKLLRIECSASTCAVQYVCFNCAALATVTTTLSGNSYFVTTIEEYSGVVAVGWSASATATSTHPGVTLTTQDANNWVVCETANLGSTGIPTAYASHGTLEDANRTGTTTSHVAGAAVDNTAATASAVDCMDTISSGVWAATGVELRSTITACASPCPTLAQDVLWGTNDGQDTAVNGWNFVLPNPTLGSSASKATIPTIATDDGLVVRVRPRSARLPMMVRAAAILGRLAHLATTEARRIETSKSAMSAESSRARRTSC